MSEQKVARVGFPPPRQPEKSREQDLADAAIALRQSLLQGGLSDDTVNAMLISWWDAQVHLKL